MRKSLFTSESVTIGHPDKICDQISDAVLDAILEKDPNARVACETSCTTGLVLVMGEITTECYVDIQSIVRKTVCDIGYNRAKFGFDGSTCGVIVALDAQSDDIALGVDRSLESKQGLDADPLDTGAGDQGMMFGYACDETPILMPLPIDLAHALTRKLAKVRQNGTLTYLRPDGKAQVTVEYEDDKPVHIDTVVVSTQHDEHVTHEQLEKDIIENVIRPALPAALFDEKTRVLVNPTGRFVIGGVLRQGPDEGRPQRELHGALYRKKHRCGKACAPLRTAGRVRDRRRKAGLRARGHLRHRNGFGRAA